MAGLLSRLRKKPSEVRCSALVVAAGSARRMEGIDKVLAPLGELPVLVHTLYAFQDCPLIDQVVVVTREDLLLEVGRLCQDFALHKVTKVVVGGRERIHSVQAGLRELPPDAPRPLVSQRVLEEAIRRAAATGAAAPALPVTDTIKRGEEGRIVETVDRSTLFAVQTPQVFEEGLIRAAIQGALQAGELLTDDCAAVERLGMPVALTEGSRENIKITTPFDLVLGEAILQAREEGTLG